MLELLIVLLFAEVVLAYLLMGEDVLSPAVVFVAVFLAAALDLWTMRETWNVNLKGNTVAVIAGCCLLFLLTCRLVMRPKAHYKRGGAPCVGIHGIRPWKLWLFLLLNVGIVALVSRKVVGVVRATGYAGSFLACIGKYSELSKFSTVNLDIGKIASNLHQLCEAEAYVWGFVLVDDWFARKKVSPLVLGNFGVTALSYFLYGSRTGGVFAVVALLPLFVMKYRFASGRKHIKRKYVLLVLAVVAAFVLSFQWLGEVINRKLNGVPMWEYVSIYLGAPIRNLNSFLQKEPEAVPLWGYNTFAVPINYLGSKLGMPTYTLDLPFRRVNGHNLGNVYTTFYPYIKDFGYVGLIPLTALMAALTQLLYDRARALIERDGGLHVSTLLYMYVFPLIAFSFFSNKFYEGLSILLLKSLVYWLLVPWFLYRVNLRDGAFRFGRLLPGRAQSE